MCSHIFVILELLTDRVRAGMQRCVDCMHYGRIRRNKNRVAGVCESTGKYATATSPTGENWRRYERRGQVDIPAYPRTQRDRWGKAVGGVEKLYLRCSPDPN